MFVNVVLVYFDFMDNCTFLLFKVFLCDIDHSTFAPILTIKSALFSICHDWYGTLCENVFLLLQWKVVFQDSTPGH